MDPDTAELVREYNYRHHLFPGASQADFEGASAFNTDWMFAIADTEAKAQETVRKRERRG